MREDIEKKMDKAVEPPPGKNVKALPKPDDPFKKKRGGKRMRRQKERFEVTEALKAANRMGFAEFEEDVYQDEGGTGLGKLGKARGRLRTFETKQKGGAISKKMQVRACVCCVCVCVCGCVCCVCVCECVCVCVGGGGGRVWGWGEGACRGEVYRHVCVPACV